MQIAQLNFGQPLFLLATSIYCGHSYYKEAGGLTAMQMTTAKC